MKVNKLKLAIVGGAAGLMGIGGVLAPVGASTLASSSAPAPIRAAAGAAADATLPSAEALPVCVKRWRFVNVSPYWWFPDYQWRLICTNG